MSLEAMQYTNQKGYDVASQASTGTNQAVQTPYVSGLYTSGGYVGDVVVNTPSWYWAGYPYNLGYPSYPTPVYDKTEKALKIARLVYKGNSADEFLKLVDEIKEEL